MNMKWVKNVLYVMVFLFVCGVVFTPQAVLAQQPKIMNSGEIKIALDKLLTLGSVLYVAAHPDDENTAALAYFSMGRKMRTGYLSLNRGAGGQNLIGTEKGPLLSALRTQELLAARTIDQTEQFFTRAVDFGYSKTPEETLAIWGKDTILEDMVFVIRKFKPDIILSRFPTDSRGGHGHHTASAVLALEAFHAAGDASRFPDQLQYVSVWQAKRIFWNSWVPYWEKATPEQLAKLLNIDTGTFNHLLGQSYQEVAALSRSMHKTQGFGAVPRRGQQLDYYDLLAGEPAKTDLFEGIDASWNRVPGSEKVRTLLEKTTTTYNPNEPEKSLPLLLEALKEMRTLPESYWKTEKMAELIGVIRSCAGLWVEAIAENDEVTTGQEVKVTAAVINRSDFPFILKKLIVPGENRVIEVNTPLTDNKPQPQPFTMKIVEELVTHPFWLREKPEKGIYPAANHKFKGLAVAPYPFNLQAVLEAGGQEITFETPIVFRFRDPVEGEKIRYLAITPPVTANFMEEVFYFPTMAARPIEIILRSGPAAVAGTLKLNLPPSWKVEPGEIPFDIKEPTTEQKITVKVTPPRENADCYLTVDLKVGDKTYQFSRLTINYSHLPLITLHPKAEMHLVRVDLKRQGKRLGYIMGSGDDIPKYLEQVGYRVDLLSDEDLFRFDLSVYDSIITGVRAYNTRDALKNVQQRLLEYVKTGGRLVVQYNTSRGLKIEALGPYPIKFSDNRVTEEDAVMTVVDPNHPLLKTPNVILPTDFDGWVQERGLYFAEEWDAQYSTPLACNDKGEPAQKGGLLFARYGKGVFIYTGFSFFRHLPAGVSGALKLFINLLSPGIK